MTTVKGPELVESTILAQAACNDGDFAQAIQQFTAAIQLNPSNYTLYSNRSAAYIRLGQYGEALDDARKTLELKPDWPKGFYRLGIALQGMMDYDEAMVAFSQGLATDPKESTMLTALVETMLKCSLRENFEPKLKQFQELKLEKTPFIIVSLVGQELLSNGRLDQSLRTLEAARSIGTDSTRLEASLLQTLGHAHWQSNNISQALDYMERNLTVTKNVSDDRAQCKSHGNLGVAYTSLGRHPEALLRHQQQLQCARSLGEPQEVFEALNQLGACCMKMGACCMKMGTPEGLPSITRRHTSCCVYRLTYRHTFAELKAPTGEWKFVWGTVAVLTSVGIGLYTVLKMFVGPTPPYTYTREWQQLNLKVRRVDPKPE